MQRPATAQEIQERIRMDCVEAPWHTAPIFDPEKFTRLVYDMSRKLAEVRQQHPNIEAMAGTGMSGLMLVGALSYAFGLPQIAVRKRLDTDHDDHLALGWFGCKSYVIIDDLVESGKTVERMVQHIGEHHGGLPAAIICYRGDVNYELEYFADGKVQKVPVYAMNAPDLTLDLGHAKKTFRVRGFEFDQRCLARQSAEIPAMPKIEVASITAVQQMAETACQRMLTSDDVAESFAMAKEIDFALLKSQNACVEVPLVIDRTMFKTAPPGAPKLPDIDPAPSG